MLQNFQDETKNTGVKRQGEVMEFGSYIFPNFFCKHSSAFKNDTHYINISRNNLINIYYFKTFLISH